VIIKLTDEQMAALTQIAAQVPTPLRSKFLQRTADLLRGAEVGDGTLYAAARQAQRETLHLAGAVPDWPPPRAA
jgi:hypothetical protein